MFRDSNLSGRSARLITDARDLKAEGWNDQISSLRCAVRTRLQRLRRQRRTRASSSAWPDTTEPGAWGDNRTPVWGRNERLPREGACFYEDANYRGEYFCVPRGATYTALPRGFNDRISSVRVFGADVRIFQNPNFRGRTQAIRTDVANLRGNWRDNVSSIRVF